jgi:hypothetical protein
MYLFSVLGERLLLARTSCSDETAFITTDSCLVEIAAGYF